MRLSERLETVLDLMPGCGRVIDVGTDHGYIPIEAVRRGKALRAIASDIGRGPLMRAVANVSAASLEDKISFAEADGIPGTELSESDVLVITGMGGPLIERILTDASGRLKTGMTLLLSPQSDQPQFRRFLVRSGYLVTAEGCASDGGKYYFVIRAVLGTGHAKPWRPFEYSYGRKELFAGGYTEKRKDLILRDLKCFGSILERLPADADARRDEILALMSLARQALTEYN
ncbi:MAG: SAM-dependent methyltransferase [Lachnospiraceae bacterium]|nr:SAM-dependent methyltransferase [Lachnospiraceae bacterium]